VSLVLPMEAIEVGLFSSSCGQATTVWNDCRSSLMGAKLGMATKMTIRERSYDEKTMMARRR
jgi:hypothetical protein